jgi:hypothetical protein
MCRVLAGTPKSVRPLKGTFNKTIGRSLGRVVESFSDNDGSSGGLVLLGFLRSAAQSIAINVPLNAVPGVRPCRVNLSNEETRFEV